MDSGNNGDNVNGSAVLDPVALTLAIWLGLIVGIIGIQRLTENAARQAALSQAASSNEAAGPADITDSASVYMIALGG